MTSHARHILGLALLLLAGTARAQVSSSTFELSVREGDVDLLPGQPGTNVVHVYAYVPTTSTGFDGPGGPVLVVEQGATVSVALHNELVGQPTALIFPGQALPSEPVAIAPGGTATYTFVASEPGTFLYEAAPLAGAVHQAAMGLHGALIVRPTGATGQAYPDPATAFATEAVLVLSEIDPVLNGSASPELFDLRNFRPRYFLINGRPYPATPPIPTSPGSRVLLRYVNAGLQQHSMSLLGAQQELVGKDGSPLAHSVKRVAETIAPGETLDAIVEVPAGSDGQLFPLMDGSLMLFNPRDQRSFGGMLTFLQSGTAGPPPTGDVAGPRVASVTLAPATTNGAPGATVTLTASVSDTATGGSNVDGAEYRVDATTSTPAPMSGAWGSPSVVASATLDASTLAKGNHTIYVRGRDSAGNWGPFGSAVLTVDGAGPLVTGLAVAPPATNGGTGVTVNATADDRPNGGAAVTAAEYFVDSAGTNGAGAAMDLAQGGTSITAVSAVVPPTVLASLPTGTHAILVHALDAMGNWGPTSTTPLVVDRTGPSVTSLVATPAATNGKTGVGPSQPVVRVTATAADDVSVPGAVSAIARVEGFLDAVVAGAAIPFAASDGALDSATETAFTDIPLTALASLAEQPHPVSVHAMDRAGNWGPMGVVNVLVDLTVPTLTGVTLLAGAGSVALTIDGAIDPPPPAPSTGPASGIAGGEYWLGATAPAPGGGTGFTGTTASIPTGGLATGTYPVGARIRDQAGNWSRVVTGRFFLPDPVFASGFETGNFSGWSSRSTTTLGRLAVTTAAALVGTYGLQAQGNNANYVQFNFGTASNPAASSFDARFHFRPNANGSNGKDVFVAATTSGFGTTVFRVRYRLFNAVPQIQVQVGGANATGWVGLLGGTSDNVVEVVWQAAGSGGPNPGTLMLYVNGTLAQTRTTTSTLSVGAFRLGSVTTGGGNATSMYFDQFAAKRSPAPLLGP